MKKRVATGLATEKAARIHIKRLLDAAAADISQLFQLPQRPGKRSEVNKQKAA